MRLSDLVLLPFISIGGRLENFSGPGEKTGSAFAAPEACFSEES